MITGKSEIAWHNTDELPSEDDLVLILYRDKTDFVVAACQYCSGMGGFYDPIDWRNEVYENVVAWAHYPTVSILGCDASGKHHIVTSVPGG